MFECFKLFDQSKIWLTYNDFENEEITVNNTDDLVAAYKLFFMEKFIKFFVHYSGFLFIKILTNFWKIINFFFKINKYWRVFAW